MSTIYTVNNKVLKNSANDKWLIKKEAPAGFVMDASNAIYTKPYGSYYVAWESPTYPDGYNGNGKQYILINNNSTAPNNNPLAYSTSTSGGGPYAIQAADMTVLGQSTGVLLDNVAGSTYGTYLVWPSPFGVTGTLEEIQAYMANVSITIVDP